MKKNKLIGDKAFYLMVLAVALPIAVQNGFTNFVNLLDNVMVGRLGTEEMSGVSIANQLIFVFNLCIFGAVSGAGIYSAQFFGDKNDEGVRHTIRYKLIIGSFIVLLAASVFYLFGGSLINIFLKGSDDGGDIQATLAFAVRYLRIMLLGLPGFMVSQVVSSTLREGGETVLPMKAGIAAISTNLVFNYFLIFGTFGFPRLGIAGAAIATVMSRYVEAVIVIIGAYRKFPLFKGVFRTLSIPKKLFWGISKASTPLLINEALWSLGMTFMVQCYSTRGLNAVAAYNIANTLNNVFIVTFMAVGNSVGIIVGQLLGAGKKEEAIDTDLKMITFSIMIATVAGLLVALSSLFFPSFYNTTPEARTMASSLLIAMGAFMPIHGFKHSTYFTLRSGGKIFVTFLFDSGFMWVVAVPIAFLVSRLTAVGVVGIYIAVESGDVLKCFIGTYLLKKKTWVNRIIE